MSRTFSANSGSVESLKVSCRCGCRPKARQTRPTVVAERPTVLAIERRLQCVAPAGIASRVRVIPPSRIADGRGQPRIAGERAEAAGLGPERVPGSASGVDDRVVAGEDPVAEPALAEVEPDGLDRVQ